MNSIGKYLVLAVAAIAIPALLAMYPQFTSFLSGIPLLSTPYFGVTILDVLYAGIGIFAADQLFFQ